LSEDEYAILDQINGMVIAGEIALEQLQRAGKKRVAEHGRKFSNHYDLADYLLDGAGPLLQTADPDALLGRVNILFRLIDALNLSTPDALAPYLSALSPDFERRPLADQIIDQLLGEDSERYTLYRNIRGEESYERRSHTAQEEQDSARTQQAMGRFLSIWIEFERQLRRLSDIASKPGPITTIQLIRDFDKSNPQFVYPIERIRRFRNGLVHGVEIPAPADISRYADELDVIVAEMKRKKL
jgi:hypothetical protein